MIKTYSIFQIENKVILAPSTDYYAKRGDADHDTIKVLTLVAEFDTEGEALEHLENCFSPYLKSDMEFTMLPTYKHS